MAVNKMALGIFLPLVAAACSLGMQPADVSFAILHDDGVTLELVVDVCAAGSETLVQETESSVTVEIRVDSKGGDCGWSEVVTLARPLGDRSLIDAYDNETIPVER